jgi:tetratricopeptide (TPR) repeat protein
VPCLTRAIALTALFLTTSAAMAEEGEAPDPCRNPATPEQRIPACTAVIDAPGTAPAARADAYFVRALSYWQLSHRERAIADYDEAIKIAPNFAAALNNRADAYLKLGKAAQGVEDIEKALQIAPQHPIYNVTRGQIGQTLGKPESAMRDHLSAMAFGGKLYVKLYQCGLKLAQLYHGPLDGIPRPELRSALRMCVDQGGSCDPMPESVTEECPEPTA